MRTPLLAIALLLSAASLPAQSNPAQPTPKAAQPPPAEAAAMIAKQFGDDFTLLPADSVLKGDFDGDGTEDAVFIVTGKNPLVNEAAYNYKVVDPYNSYWGFGDPKVTLGFVSMDPGKAKYLLAVHSWQSATPKAKFVIVNIPFQHVSSGSFRVKKKAVSAIIAEEAGGVTSAVYWDGKRYKWEAFGSN